MVSVVVDPLAGTEVVVLERMKETMSNPSPKVELYGIVEFSDKTLYFAFCDTQSHAVTMTAIVLHSYIIYLPPLIII